MENIIDNYRELWGSGTELYDGSDSSQIALTFDDGPNEPYTLQILDIFSKYSASATFFMVGKYVRQRPDIARAVLEAGHLIANHTDLHQNLTRLSGERVVEELRNCQRAIEDATGVSPSYFRPPYGRSCVLINELAEEQQLRSVIWSVIPEDYDESITTDRIASRICTAIDSRALGEIVLLHDGDGDKGFGKDRSRTVAATQKLLHYYAGASKRFVSIVEFKKTT